MNCLRTFLVIASLAAAGCAPHAIRAEYEHISHPLAGPPFGPRSEEDALDHLAILARWHFELVTVDVGLGYKLVDGGMYGPKCTGIVRVSKEFSLEDL